MTTNYTFQIGNTIRTTGTFTDAVAGGFIDPAQVFVTILEPDGVETTYQYGVDAIVKDDIGRYRFDLPLLKDGTYYVRWHSTTPLTSTEVRFASISVQTSVV